MAKKGVSGVNSCWKRVGIGEQGSIKENKRYLPPPLLPAMVSRFSPAFPLHFTRPSPPFPADRILFPPSLPSIPSFYLGFFSLEKNCMDKLGTSRKNFVALFWTLLFLRFSFLNVPMNSSPPLLSQTLLSFLIRLHPKCMFLDLEFSYNLF